MRRIWPTSTTAAIDVPSADISVTVPLAGSTMISASISPDSVSSLAEAFTKMFCLVSEDTENMLNSGPPVPLFAHITESPDAVSAVAPAASGILAISNPEGYRIAIPSSSNIAA